MIEVEDLSKRYGSHQAVRDLHFSVAKGEIVGFLGPNGAGKSTTLRMLTGYLNPTAGRIRIGGHDVSEDPNAVRKLIGYMPEGAPLYREMRVREHLAYRAAIKGVPRKSIASAIDRALERANIEDVRDRIIAQLSKGYRQRVALADALVADPPLLILDEPSSGLDPNQIREVRQLIKSFAGEKTVLLSTHILPEVEATCERVVIINSGRKVGSGRPKELRRGDQQVVKVVARGSREDLIDTLESHGEVTVSSKDDVHTAKVTSPSSEDALEAIASAVISRGLKLRELRVAVTSLEEVFAKLTTIEEVADETDAQEKGEEE